MLKLSDRTQLFIGLFLVALMAVTRGEHFASIESLPPASWAIFFLAGAYITRHWFLPALMGLVAFLDYAAVTYQGVSSFCITPAYSMLIPAYGALWLAGKMFAKTYQSDFSSLLPLVLLVLGSGVVAELISSGSFYYLSGRFADTTVAEFGSRLLKYGPSMLANYAFYIAIATVVHAIVVASSMTTETTQSSDV